MQCPGRMMDGPDKLYARCSVCRRVDYEKYEGDRCTSEVESSREQSRARVAQSRASRDKQRLRGRIADVRRALGLPDE